MGTIKPRAWFLELLVALTLLFYHLLCEAKEQLSFQHLSTQDGLFNEVIYDITQDSNGFIWFAGEYGLSRFDGKKFLHFNHSEGPRASFSETTIKDIESTDDRIWAITADGYLHSLLPSGRFSRLKIPTSLGDNNIMPVQLTADQQGGLWISTNKGMYHYAIDSQRFSKKQLTKTNQSFAAFAFDSNNHNIIATTIDGQVYRWPYKTDGYSKLVHDFGGTKVVDVLVAEGQTLLVTTANIYTMNDNDQLKPSGIFSDRKNIRIRRASWDRQNTLWVVTDGDGVFSYHHETRSLQHFLDDDFDPVGLKSKNLANLYIDNQDNLWLATYFDGVFHASLRPTLVNRILATNIRDKGSSREKYCAISETTSQELYFSNCEAGFRKLSVDRTTMVDLTPNILQALKQQGFEKAPSINTHWVENQQSIWLGTTAGLMHWDGAGQVHRFRLGSEPNSISVMMSDEHSQLWLTTNKGLYKINQTTKQTEAHVLFELMGVQEAMVTFLKPADQNQLWLGTHNHGLWLVDTHHGTVDQLFSPSDTFGLATGNDVFDVLQAATNQWWVACGAGLVLLELEAKNTRVKKHLSSQNSSLKHPPKALASDPQSGDVWLATATDLAVYKPVTDEVRIYDYSEGLPRGNYQIAGGLTSRDGDIYFVNDRGLAQVRPEKPGVNNGILTEPSSTQALVFTSYIKDNQLEHVLNSEAFKAIVLDHDDNRLWVSFSKLDFSASELTTFQYRLLGYDETWYLSDKSNTAVYTGLPGGRYTLEVRSQGGSALEPSLKLSVDVRVAPWKTPLALFSYLLVFMAVCSLLLIARSKRLKKEQAYLKAIEHSERRMGLALKGSKNVLWDWTLKPDEIFWQGLSFLGFEATTFPLSRQAYEALIHPEDRSRYLLAKNNVYNQNTHEFVSEYRLANRQGSWIWVRDKGEVVAFSAATKEPIRMAGTLQNIDDIKSVETELRHLANFDTLTSLPNRYHFNHKLPKLLNTISADKILALLFVDIDRFKNINDSMGHDFGDKVLKSVAEKLASQLPADGFLWRLSGDEFTVVLNQINHPDQAVGFAKKLIQAFSKPLLIGPNKIVVTLSLGISLAPGHSHHSSELLRYADAAMYSAKASGKNTFKLFENGMAAKINRQQKLENQLYQALENRQLSLVYQPKHSVRNKKHKSFEALLRWNSEEFGAVSPVEFVPILEETGLIEPIGSWVLEQACSQLSTWSRLDPDVSIAVNISARQLMRLPLAEHVEKLLKKYQLSASQVELEITESSLLECSESVVSVLHQIKTLGVTLSVDDFGTGYSSFSYLSRLPFDKLKIDKLFVDDIDENKQSPNLCKAMISMAHELGMSVVAEGAETAYQTDFLVDAGCDEIQGYYISKPLTAADCEALLVS